MWQAPKHLMSDREHSEDKSVSLPNSPHPRVNLQLLKHKHISKTVRRLLGYRRVTSHKKHAKYSEENLNFR
jgi:hypothetical protein